MEKWIHSSDPLPPLVKIGLAHVQIETIHPFLDGNGRIGQLLVEHWGLLRTPLLYLSVSFKRHRQAYYDRLTAVRSEGDWERWTRFVLDCVTEAVADGVGAAQALSALTTVDRRRLASHNAATVAAICLFESLPSRPLITLASAIETLGVSKPIAIKSIDALRQADILHETTGKRRDRVYAYHAYLHVLTKDTD